MNRLAVFASGNGENFEQLVKASSDGRLTKAKIVLLVCDRENAKVLERAKRLNIPYYYVNPKDFTVKEDFEAKIVSLLQESKVDFIALAGYMRLIGPTLLAPFRQRIINIHPSLLPAFAGKMAIEQAIEAKVDMTGVTIHYVDEGMDTGEIIAQESLNIEKNDDAISLAKKIHVIEHRLYADTLEKIFTVMEDKNEKSTC